MAPARLIRSGGRGRGDDATDVVVRETGFVNAIGSEARVSTGTAGLSGAVDITVVNRNEGEQMYVYRCMKVNLVAMSCMDLISGASVGHLNFSQQELVMFTTPGFEVVSDLDGCDTDCYADIVIRNTSGNSLAYTLQGGV